MKWERQTHKRKSAIHMHERAKRSISSPVWMKLEVYSPGLEEIKTRGKSIQVSVGKGKFLEQAGSKEVGDGACLCSVNALSFFLTPAALQGRSLTVDPLLGLKSCQERDGQLLQCIS